MVQNLMVNFLNYAVLGHRTKKKGRRKYLLLASSSKLLKFIFICKSLLEFEIQDN